jgi:hypothetical protein
MVTGYKQHSYTACCYCYFEFEAIWWTRAIILNFVVILGFLRYYHFEYLLTFSAVILLLL